MEFDFSKQKLPMIYKRLERECYLDPIREKLIYITPEETVRQQVISYIINTLKVPANMIRVEESLLHYGAKSRGRVDILLHKYNKEKDELIPLCVIECKAPQNMLDTNCVAVDNERETHHALQLVVDDNLYVFGNKVTFYHHGRIAVGNVGSGKIDELREFVAESYPEIIDGKRFNLGTLIDNRLWNLDEPDVIKVMENFISYALIRDEYRAYVKDRKSPKNPDRGTVKKGRKTESWNPL